MRKGYNYGNPKKASSSGGGSGGRLGEEPHGGAVSAAHGAVVVDGGPALGPAHILAVHLVVLQ